MSHPRSAPARGPERGSSTARKRKASGAAKSREVVDFGAHGGWGMGWWWIFARAERGAGGGIGGVPHFDPLADRDAFFGCEF